MIRRAAIQDLPKIMPLFEKAREFMCCSGNPHQWIDGYPSEEIIRNDIDNGNFYVEERNGRINGAFAFIIGTEPTYGKILGEWPDDKPYGTIHRLASDGSFKGLTDRCVNYCLEKIPTLRADTHKDNHPMQKALERNGFKYCGIIHVANGTPRLAFHLSNHILPLQFQ